MKANIGLLIGGFALGFIIRNSMCKTQLEAQEARLIQPGTIPAPGGLGYSRHKFMGAAATPVYKGQKPGAPTPKRCCMKWGTGAGVRWCESWGNC